MNLVRVVGSRLLIRCLIALSVVGTVGCDRVTKRLAIETLAGSAGRSFLADTVRLQYAENSGGFLSLGENLPPAVRQAVFVGGTGVLLLVLLLALVRDSSLLPRHDMALAGLAIFAAGGLSNWIDRVAHGRVVDFIVMRLGPVQTGVFNVADVAIMVGLALLLFDRMTVRAPEAPAPHTGA